MTTDELAAKLSRRQMMNEDEEGSIPRSVKEGVNVYSEFKEFSRKQIQDFKKTFDKMNRPKRKSYKAYTLEALQEAYELVRTKKMSLNRAAKHFGIPKTTIGDKLRGKVPLHPEAHTVLSKEEEGQIVCWLMECSRRGYGRSKQQLLTTVQEIIKASGRHTRFKDHKPGDSWYGSFLKRHPEVSMKNCRARGHQRALITEATLSSYTSTLPKALSTSSSVSTFQTPSSSASASTFQTPSSSASASISQASSSSASASTVQAPSSSAFASTLQALLSSASVYALQTPPSSASTLQAPLSSASALQVPSVSASTLQAPLSSASASALQAPLSSASASTLQAPPSSAFLFFSKNRPKRKSYKAYTLEDLQEAYKLVRTKKMSLNRAAKHFGIPKTTIGDKLRGKVPLQPEAHTVLSKEEEGQLVCWLMECSRRGYGRSKQQLLTTVQEIIKASGRQTPFKDHKPGDSWYGSFLKRHPEVSMRNCRVRGHQRALIPEAASSYTSTLPKALSTPSFTSTFQTQSASASTLQVPSPYTPAQVEFYLDKLLEHVISNRWTEATLFKMKRMHTEQAQSDDSQFTTYSELYSHIVPPKTFKTILEPDEQFKIRKHCIKPPKFQKFLSGGQFTIFYQEKEDTEQKKIGEKGERAKDRKEKEKLKELVVDSKRKRKATFEGKARRNMRKTIVLDSEDDDSKEDEPIVMEFIDESSGMECLSESDRHKEL